MIKGYNGNTLKPITWHTAKLLDRVFAAKVTGGALHSGTISKVGRKYVRVSFDKNGSGNREYTDVYPMREVFDAIKNGELVASVEVK